MANLLSTTRPAPATSGQRNLQLDPRNLELSKRQYDDIVLDGSASMQKLWWDMLAAIDGYVDQLSINQLDSHLRLSIFTSGQPEHMDLVARNCPLQDWVPLLTDPVGSYFSGTPLYDAINLAARRMKDLDPQRAAVTFVTDGEELDSSYTDLTQAQALIAWMKAKGWQVTFIGCNFDNSKLAAQLGVHPRAAIGVEQSHLSNAARTLAEKRAMYGKTGDQMHFSDDEKQQFGGYLSAQ